METSGGNNYSGNTSPNKALRAIAITLSLIEAIAVAAFVAVIGFDGYIGYECMAHAAMITYYCQEETEFDFDITAGDGTVYPAGYVFEVYGFTASGNLLLRAATDDFVTSHHGRQVSISEAKNSDELYQAYEDARFRATAEEFRQYLVVVLIVAGACFVSYLIFATINNKWIDEPMKQTVLFFVIVGLNLFNIWIIHGYLSRAHAPVIYLYPEQETEVNVRLTLNGKLTTTYPSYDDKLGWNVTASPDGILTDRSGRNYSYLFWEGDIAIKPDLSKGFCVKGEDTAEFLERSVRQLGLSDVEADAFIMYWLPQMEGNKYNVITFQTTAYENVAALSITPEPDTVIRVNMLWYPTGTYVDMEPQDLAAINPSERNGFTVVEWGGEKYRKPVFLK